jgi:unsaturated rhamnogalacturonyl hydrolase
MSKKFPLIGVAVSCSLASFLALCAQTVPYSGSKWYTPGEGDTLVNPLPLARLSPAFRSKPIEIAMRKVGDWELERSRPYFDQDWTFAALYTGFMAAAETLHEVRYRSAMLEMANKFDWKLDPRMASPDTIAKANYQALGQTYLGLYGDLHEARMIGPTRAQLDALAKLPDDPKRPAWWWCDALFMAPPTWTRLYRATGDRSYLAHMNREWWITSNLLYDPQEHLYFRDASYLHMREPNGKKLFWGRGNGWVMAGLARVLEQMPNDYPTRQKYVEQFRQMASRVASLQGTDGLWRAGLLDPTAYPLPELSGSSFFVYSLAWGVHHGLLDRATYLPVVQKGWKGLVTHVYVDGRLGCIQPQAGAPENDFKASSSYVYGVGAFLLAGSEAHALAEGGSSSVH